jgi:hypothetical protein
MTEKLKNLLKSCEQAYFALNSEKQIQTQKLYVDYLNEVNRFKHILNYYKIVE